MEWVWANDKEPLLIGDHAFYVDPETCDHAKSWTILPGERRVCPYCGTEKPI
jgi:hypothetical protein